MCQSNGNLLASCGESKKVVIFDKRKAQIVQNFDNIHNGNILLLVTDSPLTHNHHLKGSITCVRWSPSGDMFATASFDGTIALVDFKTGKKLYTGYNSDSDRGKFSS